MATVTKPMHTTSLPRIYDHGQQATSSIYSDHSTEGPRLHNSSNDQTLSQSTPMYMKNMQTYNNVFANWYTHSTSDDTTASGQSTDNMPQPPSALSTPPRSSMTSSPNETKTPVTDPGVTSYFNPFRTRSQSLSIPAPTSTCPNCGLRRPSITSDQATFPSLSSPATQSSPPARTHLPSHLHCPDSCPDDVHPTKELNSPITPLSRRHHRRRSSLCYAESLVDNADTIDNGGVPVDVRSSWENRAENIARKVVSKALGNDISRMPEEAIVEE